MLTVTRDIIAGQATLTLFAVTSLANSKSHQKATRSSFKTKAESGINCVSLEKSWKSHFFAAEPGQSRAGLQKGLVSFNVFVTALEKITPLEYS